LVLAGGLLTVATSAEARVVAGTHVPAHIDTPIQYRGVKGGNEVSTWNHVLHHPGATYIAIHFEDFNLAEGDYLRITDADGGQSYILDGKGKMDSRTFWAQHVKGDTMVLELFQRNADGGFGFVIDEYV